MIMQNNNDCYLIKQYVYFIYFLSADCIIYQASSHVYYVHM